MSSLPNSPESYTFRSANDEFESSNSDSGFLNSLDQSPEESEDLQTDTLLEFTTQMGKVNLAFKNVIIGKLILNIYKRVLDDKNSKISHQAVKFVKDTILADKLQKCTEMKSSSGKSFTLLGLNNCYTEGKHNLSSLEHSQLKTKALKDFEKKIEEFKDKRNTIKEVFCKHRLQLMVGQEGYLQDKTDQYSNLSLNLNGKLRTLAPQLMENAQLMAELNYYQNNNHGQIKKMTSSPVVMSKVKLLNCVTSILKEKADLLERQNENQIKYLNTSGRELEKSLNSLKERKSQLESRLDSYRRKETLSVAFRGLVTDYNKTQKELQGKTCTLSILNDSGALF